MDAHKQTAGLPFISNTEFMIMKHQTQTYVVAPPAASTAPEVGTLPHSRGRHGGVAAPLPVAGRVRDGRDAGVVRPAEGRRKRYV